jgi:hypothetical protein
MYARAVLNIDVNPQVLVCENLKMEHSSFIACS